MFAVARARRRKRADRRPSGIIRVGFVLAARRHGCDCSRSCPRADSGWCLVVPLIVAGCGLGLLVSQLNNYTLAPISEERVSEAAGVNSAAGSFGLSFGLAFAGAIMLADALGHVHDAWPTTARCSRPARRSRSPRRSRTTPR